MHEPVSTHSSVTNVSFFVSDAHPYSILLIDCHVSVTLMMMVMRSDRTSRAEGSHIVKAPPPLMDAFPAVAEQHCDACHGLVSPN